MGMSHDDLVARVRAERKKRRWTQAQLAEKIGVSLRTIQGFETRKSAMQPENLREVCVVLGIDPDSPDRDTQWRKSTQVFLDVMGAYLDSLPEEAAVQVAHHLARQIFETRDL